MKKKLTPSRPIFGLSDDETVMLDFDNISFKTVKYWAFRTMRWFKLDGFIILKSSTNSYHVIFNKSVSWTENLKVVAWAALQSQNKGLTKWLIMQCIKQSSTIRITKKNKKHSPRIVHRYGKEGKQIKHFLQIRGQIKYILKKMDKKDKS